ncbi:RluA family pseudouridine synthase [Oceanicella actignis]|uniref:RluA family pseudouridine synthase n=1 Tax=Oceanicella actignis TaxID=1189325 RepID=UPI0011E71A91
MTHPSTNDDGAVTLVIPESMAGERLDKALAALAPAGAGLSRSRIQALIEAGAVRGPDGAAAAPRARAQAGQTWRVSPPPPAPAAPAPEAIPLRVLYEDDALIVIDKPPGMVVHPAPGAESGTLVNALIAHCGESLSGVGGERRPGIVHRIDKDTSGVLVAAKTDAAHQGLAAQFAAHDLERSYLAVCWGAPHPGDPRLRGLPGLSVEPGGWMRLETQIDRHRADRKRMAVCASGGRRAVTRFRATEIFGPRVQEGVGGAAALIECRLETGRTHQIRVHLSHCGHPLVGDPVYGRARPVRRGALEQAAAEALAAFPRQALHAATLGFRHPITGRELRFSAPPPPDMAALIAALRGGAPGPEAED